MTLVDTNVLSDILSGNPSWIKWSAEALALRSGIGPLMVNDVVYAELSMGMPSPDELDRYLGQLEVQLSRTPKNALFRAARAFHAYRASGGIRTGVLPDFFIGAHAEVERLPILTRDPQRYRTYFPKVELITPDP